jgi:hypothetical protein
MYRPTTEHFIKCLPMVGNVSNNNYNTIRLHGIVRCYIQHYKCHQTLPWLRRCLTAHNRVRALRSPRGTFDGQSGTRFSPDNTYDSIMALHARDVHGYEVVCITGIVIVSYRRTCLLANWASLLVSD